MVVFNILNPTKIVIIKFQAKLNNQLKWSDCSYAGVAKYRD